MSPGWSPEWHVGIRDCRLPTKKPLVAFISAVPVNLRVRNNIIRTSEVNFLCVHKKLRNKRLTPILIKEVTRRSNLQEIWQGVYTAGIVLPKPVSTCRYYHRALDWKKLYDIGFSPLPPNSKPEWQIRKYTLPEKTATKGLREMTTNDVPAVHKLMKNYVNRFDMAPEWDEGEVAHWLLQPRGESDEQVVWSYVVEVSYTHTDALPPTITSHYIFADSLRRTRTITSQTSSPSTTLSPPLSTIHDTRWSESLTSSTTVPRLAFPRPSTKPPRKNV